MPDAGHRVERDAFARHVGIELMEVRAGFAKARLRLGPQHLNGVGVAQGGVIFSLADLAFAAACNQDAPVTVAINASICFMKAVREGVLHAQAEEVTSNPRLGAYSVRVTDDAGQTVATFQGLAYRKRSDP